MIAAAGVLEMSSARNICAFRYRIPVVLRGVYQIVNFRIDKLKNPLLRGFLVAAEFLGCVELQGSSSGGRRSRFDQELLKIAARSFEMFQVYQNLNNLTKVLRAEFVNQ